MNLPIGKIISDYESAKAERASWDSNWQDIADYMLPTRATFTTNSSKGANRRANIFDTTPELAIETLAAGLHGMFTSQAQRWFYLRPSDLSLMNNREVVMWLEKVLEIMYAVMNSPKSQFHSQIDQAYQDLAAFGTTCFYIEDSRESPYVVYQTRHLGEVYVRENAAGQIDTIYRSFTRTLEQIVERFGVEALPNDLKMAWAKGDSAEKSLELLHAVLPRRNQRVVGIGGRSMPWASAWMLVDQKHALRESGYREFPYQVARWRVRTGETYGVGPGLRMLPEVRMLNEMFKTVMKAAQKTIDPPLQMPDNSFIGPVRTMPSGINYYRSGTADRIEPINTDSRIDIGLEMLERQREIIREGFFNDAFDITSDSDGVNVKATFTHQRRDDKFRKLAPVQSRLGQELLQGAIERTYAILERRRVLPEPPEVLADKPLSIEYVSPVARAMRTTEADDIMRLLELAAPLGEISPDSLHNIDADEALRLAGTSLFNVPPSILRDKKEVERMRQESNEQAQTEQALVSGVTASEALRNAASASKDFQSI